MRAALSVGLWVILCAFQAQAEFQFENGFQKTWTTEEIQRVQTTLTRFENLGLKNFFEKIKSNGFTRALRHTRHEASSGEQGFQGWVAWINLSQKTVNFTDTFFAADFKDSAADFALVDAILFHELVHAFLSANPALVVDFSNRVGFFDLINSIKFGTAKGSLYFGALFEMNIISNTENSPLKEQKMFEISRRTAKLFKIPTLYALKNQDEFIAEMATYAFLDPNAKDYINEDALSWLIENILN